MVHEVWLADVYLKRVLCAITNILDETFSVRAFEKKSKKKKKEERREGVLNVRRSSFMIRWQTRFYIIYNSMINFCITIVLLLLLLKNVSVLRG